MKDINRLLKTYYNYDGSEKYVQGETWSRVHHRENNSIRQKRNAWKDLLTQMNEIRNSHPEIQFSEEQRQIAKELVNNTSYIAGNYNTQQINLIIIIYVFNWLYGNYFDFSEYLDDCNLNERKIEYFILKYIKKLGE